MLGRASLFLVPFSGLDVTVLTQVFVRFPLLACEVACSIRTDFPSVKNNGSLNIKALLGEICAYRCSVMELGTMQWLDDDPNQDWPPTHCAHVPSINWSELSAGESN